MIAPARPPCRALLLLTALLAVAGAALLTGRSLVEEARAGGGAVKQLEGCAAQTLVATDDGSAGPVPLSFTLDFLGPSYDQVFVNNNGNLSFGTHLRAFTPFDISQSETPVVAPFFADVDTQGLGSGLATYGNATFEGHPAFCASWIDVGYYNDRTDKLNSFQVLLVERFDRGAGDFDIVFNYDKIEWETGDANGGSGGLGGDSARAGYSNGTTGLELAGSGVPGAFLDSNHATGLVHNSHGSSRPGRYVYAIANGGPPLVTVTPSATRTPTPDRTATPVAPPGDASCNGRVDSVDAALVLQRSSGLKQTLPCPAAADVNGDGRADNLDATLILQFVAALLPGLPV